MMDEHSSMQRRFAAILAADIAGYCRLMGGGRGRAGPRPQGAPGSGFAAGRPLRRPNHRYRRRRHPGRVPERDQRRDSPGGRDHNPLGGQACQFGVAFGRARQVESLQDGDGLPPLGHDDVLALLGPAQIVDFYKGNWALRAAAAKLGIYGISAAKPPIRSRART